MNDLKTYFELRALGLSPANALKLSRVQVSYAWSLDDLLRLAASMFGLPVKA